MRIFHFITLRTPEGWCNNTQVTIDDSGLIVSITPQADPKSADITVTAPAMPGFINAHSHIFQYQMAGLAEHIAPKQTEDDFWTWRQQMYKLALSLGPDELFKIACTAFRQMLRYGITHTVEFHYLHHDKDGKPYQNPAEMSLQIIEAAKKTGMNVNLLPVYYQTKDFGEPASPEQRRFIHHDFDHFSRLLEIVESAQPETPGLALHSMRAVPIEIIKDVFASYRGPTHLHISEQVKEVEACIGATGCRPVEWLLENCELDERHSLVHATHLTDSECKGLAKSRAQVILCPSTEGNLGDGFFPLKSFINSGGRWTIGTDSHICLNPMEELRWLDYQSRLFLRKRNPLATPELPDSGEYLYNEALTSGSIAYKGVSMGITPGNPLSFIELDNTHPCIAGRHQDQILSSLIFTGDSSCIKRVFNCGRFVDLDLPVS